MNTQLSQIQVTRELVPEDRRIEVVERLFGIHFPLQLEPVIHGITDRMADDYSGGYPPSTASSKNRSTVTILCEHSPYENGNSGHSIKSGQPITSMCGMSD